MTILVGMIGSDGILLAADRSAVRLAEDNKTLDDKIDIYKINVLEKHKIAYAGVGDEVTREVGTRLRRMLNAGAIDFAEFRDVLERLASTVIKEEIAAKGVAFDDLRDRSLLIIS